MSTSPIDITASFAERRRLERLALWLAAGSLVWHLAEGVLSIAFGIAAESVALIGFGADSFIETAAGVIVVWRMTGRRVHDAHRERAELLASRAIGVTFMALAAYVTVHATWALVTGERPEASIGGIVLAAATLATMPPLAIAKQRVGRALDSCAATSEGAQNMICAYLSAGLLVGLGANAVLGWWWADPIVALAIAAVAVREGITAWRGTICAC